MGKTGWVGLTPPFTLARSSTASVPALGREQTGLPATRRRAASAVRSCESLISRNEAGDTAQGGYTVRLGEARQRRRYSSPRALREMRCCGGTCKGERFYQHEWRR